VYFNGSTITWKLTTPARHSTSLSYASASSTSPKCAVPITSEALNVETISITNSDPNANNSVNDKNLIPFPNPTKGLVQFNIPNTVITEQDVEVYGETGIRYFTTLNGNPALGKFTLDFSRLINGVYITRIKTNNGYKEYRIIKF
jgi:hypothetical protein